MATLVELNNAEAWDVPIGTLLDTHQKLLNELETKEKALEEGEVVGAILSFPVADGYAMYLVQNEAPLEVAHIPYGDAWQVHHALLKGLDVEDVKEQINQRKALAKLFG